LEEDKTAPRKQRHTARRIWVRLTQDYGARVAESTVRAYVAEVRRQMSGAVGEVMVPQSRQWGAVAEVDFGAVVTWLDGVYEELWMFCLRLSGSGRAFHEVFANEAMESFLEGHVHAFEYFEGVPAGVIRYDNLKDAVIKVLLGRARLENPRFVAFRSHYGFDSWYCRPGIQGSHEKGGVEGEIGRFRRNHLVPVPRVQHLDELNELLAAADAADDARRIGWRTTTVGEDFAVEAAWLAPLPAERFETATVLRPVVDAKSRVVVRQSRYSVPARLVRRRVEVRLHARHLDVVADGKVVASHSRAIHKGEEHLVLDHYLEVLVHKPGALAGSAALAQARAAGAFGQTHQAFWDLARRRLGDTEGTKALCMVLLLQRSVPASSVMAGMAAAMAAGSVDPEVVAVEARRAAEVRPALAAVVPIGALVSHRPVPALEGYDQLLGVAR
jgi:transposase